jgi:hypothetical protein
LAVAALHPDRSTGVLAIGSSGRHGRFTDVPADLSWASDMAERFDRQGSEWLAREIEQLGGTPWIFDETVKNDPSAMATWCRAKRSVGL